ncbi:hypothetical protein MY1884_005500 [Beauveria asiatica]
MVLDSSSKISFTSEHKRSSSAEDAVKAYAQTDSRSIETALVKSIPKKAGGDTWHVGGTNANAPEHITVEFWDASGGFITTKHIDRQGNAV